MILDNCFRKKNPDMYDPELALRIEQDLLDDEIRLAKVAERLGNDHPWTERVKLVTDILKILSQKKNDLDNCFDPITKFRIEAEINELVSIAHKTLSLP